MLELKTFQPDDFSALISWFPSEAALQDFAGPGARWPLDREQLDHRTAEPDLRSWTAYQPPATEPIGHIELVQIAPQHVRLDRVAIAPSHRGQGLSAELVRAALAQLDDPRPQTIDLLVSATNVPARRTYLGVGFTDIGAISPDHPTVRRMSLRRA